MADGEAGVVARAVARVEVVSSKVWRKVDRKVAGLTAALPAAEKVWAGKLKRSFKLNGSVTGSGNQTSGASVKITTSSKSTYQVKFSGFGFRGGSRGPGFRQIFGAR